MTFLVFLLIINLELESLIKRKCFYFSCIIDSFLDVRCENGELLEGNIAIKYGTLMPSN